MCRKSVASRIAVRYIVCFIQPPTTRIPKIHKFPSQSRLHINKNLLTKKTNPHILSESHKKPYITSVLKNEQMYYSDQHITYINTLIFKYITFISIPECILQRIHS